MLTAEALLDRSPGHVGPCPTMFDCLTIDVLIRLDRPHGIPDLERRSMLREPTGLREHRTETRAP